MSQEHGNEAVKEINKDFGIPASFYKVVSLDGSRCRLLCLIACLKDVRDPEAVDEAVAGINRDFKRIDVLVAAAGVVDNFKAEGASVRTYETSF